VVDKDGHKSDF